jgi:hypothetical protein
MKYFLVLQVFVLAALGAPGPQPVLPVCPSPPLAGSMSHHVWLDSLYGPPDTIYGDTLMHFGVMLHTVLPAPHTMVYFGLWTYNWGLYCDPHEFSLGARDSALFDWGYQFGRDTGLWWADDETDSSVVLWQFYVAGRPRRDQVSQIAGHGLLPLVLRHLPFGALAFDAMGRRVLNPKPGIYFLRAAPTAQLRKVLLVE